MYSGYVGIGTRTSLSSSTSALNARSMASDVPSVRNTRSGDTGKPWERVLAGNGLPCFGQTGRWSVSVVAVAHGALHGLEQVGWRLKAKGRGVSDVQVAHHGPLRLDPSRFGHDVPNGVGEAVDSAGDLDLSS